MNPSARRSVPWGLLGMVVLVAAVETGLGRCDLHLRDLAAANYRFPVSDSVPSEALAECDVLCFGDSLVKQGVSPRVLEEQAGARAYNLGVAGAMPAATFFLLRRTLAAGARPSVVLVDFDAVASGIDPRHSESGTAELATPIDCLDAAWTCRCPRYFAALTLARLFPSIRYRTVVRDLLRDACFHARFPGRPPAAPLWDGWAANQGAQLNPKAPGPSAPWTERDWTYFRQPPRRCHWRSAAYIHKFLSLADRAGIAVYCLLPPLPPALQARHDQIGFDAPQDQFLRQTQARFPTLTVIDARHSGYDARLFFDVCHLDHEGARVFTTQVAAVLRHARATPAPRWIELPRDLPQTAAHSGDLRR